MTSELKSLTQHITRLAIKAWVDNTDKDMWKRHWTLQN